MAEGLMAFLEYCCLIFGLNHTRDHNPSRYRILTIERIWDHDLFKQGYLVRSTQQTPYDQHTKRFQSLYAVTKMKGIMKNVISIKVDSQFTDYKADVHFTTISVHPFRKIGEQNDHTRIKSHKIILKSKLPNNNLRN
ncbi:unnamed protein product [Rhizophagus irregularis]|nr:unnamed protein product [Rhizophagus irregularis]